MVMADRPEVDTAPGPIAAVDAVVLAQQLAAAMVRVPFRAPLRGPSNVVANLGTSVTREAVRSFMGYASSLPVDEFRSIEQLLDNVCRVVPWAQSSRRVHQAVGAFVHARFADAPPFDATVLDATVLDVTVLDAAIT
jgi:hypothetical protein